MRDQFIGHRTLLFVTLGLAAALSGACGNGPLIVPSPSPLFPSGVNSCGAISGLSAGDLAIVNGSSCTPGTASVALLSLKDSDNNLRATCSGTVISSTAVLTAAHCLDGTASVTISFGAKSIPAASFAYSPDYDGTASKSIDVGVVIASAPLGQPIVPILNSRDAAVGETAVIAGYGQDLLGQTAGLRAGATTLTEVGAVFLQTQAGISTAGACPGDSGGPLLVSVGNTWTIAGVTATLAGPCVLGTNNYLSVRNATARSFILGKVPDAVQR